MSPTLGTVHGFAPNVLRGVRPPPPAALQGVEYNAFYSVGVGFLPVRSVASRLDLDGNWIADVGTLTVGFSPPFSSLTRVERDPSGSPRLLIGYATAGSSSNGFLQVGNFTGGGTSSRAGTSGFDGIKVQRWSLIADGGYFYWLEVQRDAGMTSRLYVRLYRAELTVASPTLLVTTTLDHGYSIGPNSLCALSCALTGEGFLALISVGQDVGTPQSTVWLVNASTGASAISALSGDLAAQGVPALDGRAFGGSTATSPVVKTTADDTVDAADHWPDFCDPGWLSISPDQTELGVYAAGTTSLAHDFAEAPWGAAPRRLLSIGAHPTYGFTPFLVTLRDPTL